jgi:hypothetical protein
VLYNDKTKKGSRDQRDNNMSIPKAILRQLRIIRRDQISNLSKSNVCAQLKDKPSVFCRDIHLDESGRL